MIISLISSVFLIIGIALLFGLNPSQIADDLLNAISPRDSLRDEVRSIRGNRQKHGIFTVLMNMKNSLAVSGKAKQFALVFTLSLVLFAVGCVLAILINNPFLLPAFSVAFALLPFFYTANALSVYDRKTKEELENSPRRTDTELLRNSITYALDTEVCVHKDKCWLTSDYKTIKNRNSVKAALVS